MFGRLWGKCPCSSAGVGMQAIHSVCGFALEQDCPNQNRLMMSLAACGAHRSKTSWWPKRVCPWAEFHDQPGLGRGQGWASQLGLTPDTASDSRRKQIDHEGPNAELKHGTPGSSQTVKSGAATKLARTRALWELNREASKRRSGCLITYLSNTTTIGISTTNRV